MLPKLQGRGGLMGLPLFLMPQHGLKEKNRPQAKGSKLIKDHGHRNSTFISTPPPGTNGLGTE